MKGIVGVLKVAVIGFALIAGGRALYRHREKLKETWKTVGGPEGIKGYAGKLSVSKVLESIGPLRNLVGQVTHLK